MDSGKVQTNEKHIQSSGFLDKHDSSQLLERLFRHLRMKFCLHWSTAFKHKRTFWQGKTLCRVITTSERTH
jgi:hypothetical protein